MPFTRKPYIVRYFTRPEADFRRMLIYGPGNAGFGNAMLAGFALIAILADLANSGTPETLGKVLAANIMLAIPVGIAWTWLWATTIWYFAKWTGAPKPVGKLKKVRFWATLNRVLLPMLLANMAVCLDLIVLDGAPWLPGGSTGGLYFGFWFLKLLGIGLSVWWVQKFVAMRFHWPAGKTWMVVLGALSLAFALIFLIFVVLLGIPIR